MSDRLRLAFVVPIALFAACTTNTVITEAPPPAPDAGPTVTVPDDDAEAPPPDDTVDAADAAPIVDASVKDARAFDANYAAAHPAIPLADFGGGTVILNPKIVTVTVSGDAHRAELEQFDDLITATPWWDAVTDGYCSPAASTSCIARGTPGGHVVLASLPSSTFTDSSDGTSPSTMQAFIKAEIGNKTLPAPTVDTLYMIYLPSTVTVTLDTLTSCQGFGGYHDAFKFTPAGGTEISVAYAVVPRCTGAFTDLTLAASHEMMEAATDPSVGTGLLGYVMSDPLWSALYGGEVGDLCFSYSSDDIYMESGYQVQRGWSNKAARSSHDPCVPAPPLPYFNTAIDQLASQTALGIGQSADIPLTGFSDGPVADWALSAADALELQTGQAGSLSFAFDMLKANNGTKISMKVTLTSDPPNGIANYEVISRSGGVTHTWPGVIVKQ